ncbi:MAG: hypothetical protein E4G90_11140 [Gemmatimonadales bacterium]|nr:MAG: hypothetical protein E4G90_11140 [Gemmatimonadales bacterium]
MGFTFTGAGSEVLELCSDKRRAKEALEGAGIPTPAWRLCESPDLPGSQHYEGIHTLLPAPLCGSELAAMEAVCRQAYQVIGCRDYGRLDLRVRDGVCFILDVNPNADISYDASLACAAEG